MAITKKCSRCKEDKPKAKFGKRLGCTYGQHYCKSCMKKYNKQARDKRNARLKNTSWF